MISASWTQFKQLPASAYFIGGAIALALCWETAQTIAHANSFQPNAPVPLVATLHSMYLPNAPNDHNNINPKVDWYGLEEHLYYCTITQEQSKQLLEYENKAVEIIDSALKAYASVTDSLTDEQIELLLRPQENVASTYSLGLDCGSREHQLISLYCLTKRSKESKTPPAAVPLLKNTNLTFERSEAVQERLSFMDPTRLLVSLQLLTYDRQHRVTPEQASYLLTRYRAYCECLFKLYYTLDKALQIFSDEQLMQNNGLAQRLWESSSSPVALRETRQLILARTQGARP
ncbi:hypothetical protein IJT17_00535 [bacterium]|nr:hypothetical protein [bacterium]